MRKLIAIIGLLALYISMYSQSFDKDIYVSKTYMSSETLFPFTEKFLVNGLSVSGDVKFNSDTSFIRIVVSDENGYYFMLYETYPMISNKMSFSFKDECEETSFFDNFYPRYIEVQIKDATLNIDKISWHNQATKNANQLRDTKKLEINKNKVENINEYIITHKLLWKADETYVSEKYYSEKAEIFGKDYITFGYEYYTDGFYSPLGPDGSQISSHGYVANFDWRNRHGANNSSSPYYDGDPLGTGWLTKVVCQGGGCWINGHYVCNVDSITCRNSGGIFREAAACWDFGPVAQVEALVNLYYNEHIDLKLSEQYIMCKENQSGAWYPSKALDRFKGEGVPDDDCLTYSASLENCSDSCLTPNERVWINNYSTVYGTNNIREAIMNNGPLTGASINMFWGNWSHAMALAGWGTIDEENVRTVLGYVPSYAPEWYGTTYWIYKQSMGIAQHDTIKKGFDYVIHWDGVNPTIYKVATPITTLNRTSSDINCYDNDGDGYYFWGIGPKPAHCPPCPDQPDGDDSNPSLGPLNAKGQCTVINTYNSSFETGWDNWVQVNNDDGDWWRHKGAVNNNGFVINGAQDGDYYVYVNSNCNGCYSNKKFILESPPINLVNECEIQVEFYYHLYTGLWGNPDSTELALQVSFDNGNTWSQNYWYKRHNQGPGWKKAVVSFPSNVNKIRFVAKTGLSFMSDIALDNITIGAVVSDNEPLYISENTTWQYDKKIYNDIIVDNAAVFTISNCVISLFDNIKIIVKPGSKLVVNNSTLTSLCSNKIWHGIQVVGNINMPQMGQYQGTVEIKNGSVLENARFGIATYEFVAGTVDPRYNSSGGIIIAEDVAFRNNRKSVVFMAYPDNGTNPILPNISSFKNCSFVLNNNNLFASSGTGFESHISMWGVNGVKIKGCVFENNTIDILNDRYKAIYTESAGYNIDELCLSSSVSLCTCSAPTIHSQFRGFNKAIESSYSGKQYAIFIDDSDFDNNNFGITIRGMNNFQISRSFFNVVNSQATIQPCGIYFDNCTGYKIEENNLSSSNSYSVGIWVNRAGMDENLINRNIIQHTYTGIKVTGIIPLERSFPSTGLQFRCNDLNYNSNDIFVYNPGIIRSTQGSIIQGADNLFSPNASYNMFIGTQQVSLTYYYDNTTRRKFPNNNYGNISLLNAAPNICSSTLCNDASIYKNTQDKTAIEEYIKLKNIYFDKLNSFYSSGYDEILNNYYNGIIKDELLLKAAIAAHEYLLELTESMAEIANAEVLQIKLDSILDLNKLVEWYNEIYTLDAKYSLAETYYQLGNYEQALSVLKVIPVKYELNNNALVEYKNYISLFDLKNNVRLNGRTLAQLNDSEIGELKKISENSFGLSSVIAQSVLCFFYNICDENLPADDVEIEKPYNNNSLNANIVKVYPNPGSDYITVFSDYSSVDFYFYNINGMLEQHVKLNKGENNINTSKLNKGVYIYKATFDDEISTGKWVKN